MQDKEQAGLVLIIEDNRNISEMVGEYLESRGFEVDYAADGVDGYRLASENTYDAIVLDLMLPRLDGVEVCKRLRGEARRATPILMLTARDTLDDKLTGLSSGADDYLTKPFGVGELLARMRTALRHANRIGPESSVLSVGELRVDLAARLVLCRGERLQLTPLEYKLLATLMKHSGKVLTHRFLLKEVWGPHASRETHYLRVFVAGLRRKLGDDPARSRYIQTEQGVGYRFAAE